MMRLRWSAPLVCLLAAAACTWRPTGSFRPNPPSPGPAGFPDVVAAVNNAPARSQPPVAVGVTKAPSTIYVWDLEHGQKLWERPVTARSAPHIFGRYLVTEEREEGVIVVRNLRTGDEHFSFENDDLRLVGGDGEGNSAVIGLSTGVEDRAYSTLLFIHNDRLAWRFSVGFTIGAPALRGGHVFVPWATQTLSVLDAKNGRQMMRLRMDDVLGHVFVDRGSVYMGQHAVFRLTESFQAGVKAKATRYAPKARSLPGQPPLLRDAYEPPLGPESAVHRLKLVWRPVNEGETIHLEDETLYFLFYRLVFALEPDSDGLRWIFQHDVDLVGASVQPGGLLLADINGDFLFVTANHGQVVWRVETGLSPTVVRFRAGEFSQGFEPDEGPPPLRERLFSAARLADSRLSGGRALAVKHLARIEDAEATRQLITLCEAGDIPPPVKNAACSSLGERSTGSKHVLAALKRRAAFLQDEDTPPVGALSRAAKTMKIKNAVPLLLRHLADPHTPDQALPPLMNALKELGTRSSLRPVESFLLLYHADPSSGLLNKALVTAVDAVAQHRGKAGVKLLRKIADDPMSITQVRMRASQKLRELKAPSKRPSKRSSKRPSKSP